MRGLGSGIKEFKNASKEEKASQKKENNYYQLFIETVDNIEFISNMYSLLETDGANANPSTTIHSLDFLSSKM